MQHFTRTASAGDASDDVQTIVMPSKKPYHHFESSQASCQIHFYLNEDIGDPYEYTEIFHRLLTATSNDVVFFHLNTPGGRLDTGVQLINAMRNSQARIVTCLECNAFSLGTLIFLSGDEMLVNDHCMLMFHDYHGGTGGKGNEQVSHINATAKWFANLLKKVYVPFLTEEEVDRILRGEDLWMSSPEIKVRLNKMVKILSGELSAPKKPRKVKKDPIPPADATDKDKM